MRKGFSLIELMQVVAVSGLLCLIALPRLSSALDRVEVEAAAHHLLAAHQRARIMAVVRSEVLVLTIDPTSFVIRRRGQATPLWADEGPAASGVVLTGPTRQFIFSPQGFTLGLSNASFGLTRGSASRTVVVSRLGRARILR